MAIERKRKITKKSLNSIRKAINFFGGKDSDLAKVLGINRTLVGRWRRGDQPISLRCAVLIENKSKGKIKIKDLCDYESFLVNNKKK